MGPKPLADAAGSHDRDLRRIDDGIDRIDTVFTQARDGNRRRYELARAHVAAAHPDHEVAELPHQRLEILAIGIEKRGRDETATAHSDGGTDVDRDGTFEASVAVVAVETLNACGRKRHGLDDQHALDQPLTYGQ